MTDTKKTPRARTCPPIRNYIFPDTALATLTSWFQSAGSVGVEDIAVAAGLPSIDGDAVVVSVLHPDAAKAPGWYEQRDTPAWDELYRFGFDYGLYYLLQVHTHPRGYPTRHSPRDDIGAFCDRVGFLSIVVPDFADRGVDLHDPAATVHERTATGWRVWQHAEVRDRLVVVPATSDLQSTPPGRGAKP